MAYAGKMWILRINGDLVVKTATQLSESDIRVLETPSIVVHGLFRAL